MRHCSLRAEQPLVSGSDDSEAKFSQRYKHSRHSANTAGQHCSHARLSRPLPRGSPPRGVGADPPSLQLVRHYSTGKNQLRLTEVISPLLFLFLCAFCCGAVFRKLPLPLARAATEEKPQQPPKAGVQEAGGTSLLTDSKQRETLRHRTCFPAFPP